MTQIEGLKFLCSVEWMLAEVPQETRPVLFDIAQNPGTDVVAIGKRLNTPLAGTARAVSVLCAERWVLDVFNRKKPGLALVEKRKEPGEHRANHLYLTSKGQHLIGSLWNHLRKQVM